MKNWYELTETYLLLALDRLKEGKIITSYEELEQIVKRFEEKIFEEEDETEDLLQSIRRDIMNGMGRLRKGEIIDAYKEISDAKDRVRKHKEKLAKA